MSVGRHVLTDLRQESVPAGRECPASTEPQHPQGDPSLDFSTGFDGHIMTHPEGLYRNIE